MSVEAQLDRKRKCERGRFHDGEGYMYVTGCF